MTSSTSRTPRTDEAVVSAEYIRREMDYYTHKFVLADVARTLELEAADLRERLAKARTIAWDWGQGVTDAETAIRLLHKMFPIQNLDDAIAALSAQSQPKKCEKHPRYVTEPFCPDCRSESERALSAQQEPKPTSDELEKVIADFCENFECDGADGEDEPVTDAQRKFARGVIDGLLADPAWDELWGRQIEEMVRQRMAAQPQQEPVAWYYERGTDRGIAFNPDRDFEKKWTPLYTAPPSGVREGMLWAAEICKDKIPQWADSPNATGALQGVVSAITRAAEQVNAEPPVPAQCRPEFIPPGKSPDYDRFGYALAMRVLQSDLYHQLDERERSECDEFIRAATGKESEHGK
jgi:hypothetical protein